VLQESLGTYVVDLVFDRCKQNISINFDCRRDRKCFARLFIRRYRSPTRGAIETNNNITFQKNYCIFENIFCLNARTERARLEQAPNLSTLYRYLINDEIKFHRILLRTR